ncbi:YceI family protein [Marinifilum sp. D714]|uniref:YceI family protein n=1 Tax=Marinifilum sp. D714 TaxID=2937523 RepID=UPI0027CE85B5|nr:YceI family protein [Marinifilum sp. D714]MDQ2179351.1 YceI family protein [Marinifilum sp. D714]
MIRRLMLLAMIIGGIHFTCSSQNINTEKSKIEFRVANLGANKVKGNFSGMKGNVNFDPKNISSTSFDVCIDATTFNTRMKKRDKVVKGEKYLDVANYPEICFKSTGVSRNGMSYKLSGILTMHGESKEVEIIFNYSRQTFTGKLQVNRLDFKVGPQSGVLVGKVIDITITCVIE